MRNKTIGNKIISVFLAVLMAFGTFTAMPVTAMETGTVITADFTDANFKAAVYAKIGKSITEDIFDTDVNTITALDVSNKNILSLAGIEHFIGLSVLYCQKNQLTVLPALPSGLTELACSENQLTVLPALPSGLTKLSCDKNQLTNMPMLPTGITELHCNNNQLTNLPLLPIGITDLYCQYNLLTGLNVTGLTLSNLDCSNNYMVSVSAVTGFTDTWGGSFTFSPQNSTDITASFTDANFKAAVYSKIGKTAPAPILNTDVSTITIFDVSSRNIASLAGLEYFVALTRFSCYDNQLTVLPTLPAGLTDFTCSKNHLTTLPTLPSGLTGLACSENQLTMLPALPSGLTKLFCEINPLTAMPLLPTGITELYCQYNKLTGLNVTGLPLTHLNCSYNKMANASAVTGFTGTWGGNFIFDPQNALDITAKFTDVNFKAAVYTRIGKTAPAPILDTDVNTIASLNVSSQNISSLAGLDYFIGLTALYCNNNHLTTLPGLPAGLKIFSCYNNSLAFSPTLPSGLTEYYCNNNLLPSINVTGLNLTNLNCSYNNMQNKSAVIGFTGTWGGNFIFDPQNGTDITASFTDANFKAAVCTLIGKAVTAPIFTSDVMAITSLDMSNKNISNLAGIEHFTALTQLDCSTNQLMALPTLPSGLTTLNCNGNQLTAIPALPTGLKELYCVNNQVTTLPTLPAGLTSLTCSVNKLTSLPAPLPAGLTELFCSSNQLANLPSLPSTLKSLSCYNNKLMSLPVLPSGLIELYCNGNLLTGLDVTGLALVALNCANNNIPSKSSVTGFTGTWSGSFTFDPQNSSDITAKFTDANFKAAVYTTIGKTAPAAILSTDVNAIASLDVSSRSIASLAGIEYFAGLTTLYCNDNQLTALPTLPGGLTELYCNNNNLTGLNVTGLVLTHLNCTYNNMSSTSAVTGFTGTWGGNFIFDPQLKSIFAITATAGAGGVISPSGSVNVTGGTSQTFTITPNSGYSVASVTVDGVNKGVISNFTFTNVTAVHTISAMFTQNSTGGNTPATQSKPEAQLLDSNRLLILSVAPPVFKQEAQLLDSNGNISKSFTINMDNSTGTATVEVDTASLTSAFDKSTTDNKGMKTVEIDIPKIDGAKIYQATLPAGFLTSGGTTKAVEIKTGMAVVTVPGNMLAATDAAGVQNISLTIAAGDKNKLDAAIQAQIGDRPVVELNLKIDGKQTAWSNENSPVTISMTYTPTAAELANPEGIVIWYIDGSGSAVSVPNGHYDPATGTVTFTTTHFSRYAVGYSKVRFNDVAAGAWYNKPVGFIAARGITTGTGGGNFSPDEKLTRGQFIVMLMKAYGIAPDANSKDNFSDAGRTYYSGYLAAAKRLGITVGVGDNMFAPEKEITRQEMFTLLYNALKVISQLPRGDSGKAVSDFTDAGQISSWAKDAMTLLVETRTVGGNAGKLAPTGTTTRAEMAQVLYNLLSK